MQGFRGRVLDNKGYNILMEVDLPVVMSNLLNFYTQYSQFPAAERPVDWDRQLEVLDGSGFTRSQWYSMMARPEPADFVLDAKGEPTNERLPRDVGKEVPPGLAASLAATLGPLFEKSFHRAVLWNVYASFAPPVPRWSWGECLRGDLVSNERSQLGEGAGILPATGWARSVLLASWESPSIESAFGVAHPQCDSVMAIAAALMRIDRYRFAPEVMQPPQEINGISQSNKWYGGAKVVEWILDRLYAYGNLYRLQAIKLLRAPWARFRRACKEYYLARGGLIHQELIRIDESIESTLASIPSHGFTSYVESVFQTGVAETVFGDHDALYVPLHHKTEEWLEKNRGMLRCGNEGTEAALPALYENHILGLAPPRGRDDCSPTSWGWSKLPAGSPGYVSTSALRLAVAYQSDKVLSTHVDELARLLKWTRVTGSFDRFNLASCDFAITDGRLSTRPIDQIACGLTPVLSFGNKKAQPIEPDMDKHFNPRTQLIYVLPVHGKIETIEHDAYITQVFLPRSMLMGEDGVEIFSVLNFEGVSEPLVRRSLMYFKRMSAYYIREDYGPINVGVLSGADANYVHNTGWDPEGVTFGVGDGSVVDRDRLTALWQAAIVDERLRAEDQVYAQAASGTDGFYLRTLVRSARNGRYWVVGTNGQIEQAEPDRTFVLYTNDFQFRYDFKELDKFLTQTPASLAGGEFAISGSDIANALATAFKGGA